MKTKDKETFFFLTTTMAISIATISLTSFAISMTTALGKVKITKDCINIFKEQYQNELTIVTLNDEKGLNTKGIFATTSFPDYIANTISSDTKMKVNNINLSSTRFNDTNYVDQYLLQNLTIGEIVALNKVASEQDWIEDYPSILKGLSHLELAKIDKTLEKYHLTELLATSNQPIILYNSGQNDWFSNIHHGLYDLEQYDSNGNLSMKYMYTVNKVIDGEEIDQVMEKIEENFKNILAVNANSKIVATSIFVPRELRSLQNEILIDGINQYNEKLKALCKKYQILCITTEDLEDASLYALNKNGLTTDGHKALAKIIMERLSENFANEKEDENQVFCLDVENNGLVGTLENMKIYLASLHEEPLRNDIDEGYSNKVYQEQVADVKEEISLIKKVLQKENRK